MGAAHAAPAVDGCALMRDQIPVAAANAGKHGVNVNRASDGSGLTAPFPYYGGKSRHAKEVWKRFGNPDVYAEPFAGSLAVLLGRANPCRREVVCDLDGHIANFWRAMQAEPGGSRPVGGLSDDPPGSDGAAPLADRMGSGALGNAVGGSRVLRRAGRWLVGVGQVELDRQRMVPGRNSEPLGCATKRPGERAQWDGAPSCRDGRPATHGHPTGAGVQVGRVSRQIPAAPSNALAGQGVQVGRDQIPTVPRDPGGGGVQAQRDGILGDKRPHVTGNRAASVGCAAGKIAAGGPIGTGERLLPWFHALQQRLARVIVLNRSWESAVTPSILSDTASSPDLTRAVFLDPPYPTDKRQGKLYGKDDEGQAATAAYEWAVEHGDRYRIAYCCIPGQFPVPEGWSNWTLKTKGAGSTDIVMFSPCCLSPENRSLF